MNVESQLKELHENIKKSGLMVEYNDLIAIAFLEIIVKQLEDPSLKRRLLDAIDKERQELLERSL